MHILVKKVFPPFFLTEVLQNVTTCNAVQPLKLLRENYKKKDEKVAQE